VYVRSQLSGTLVKDGAFRPGVRQGLRIVAAILLSSGAVQLVRGGGPGVLGTTAEGRVVELRQDTGSRSRDYSALIRFTAEDGSAIEVWRRFTRRTRSARRLEVGDPVTVAYFRGSPAGAQAQDDRADWWGGVILLFVGALLIGVSFADRLPRGERT
jgi:hypothetical protein